MERRRSDGGVVSSEFVNGESPLRSATPTLQPNYNSKDVQEVLKHLASIDLIELCNEAKIERCRATRDLGRCGRYVHHVLNSCRHASLCAECSQRCDLCPICRIPIPKTGNRISHRLYYECMEAGLISKKYDDRFQEKEDGEKQLTADIQRLYCLFDVAMENNLVSLICHYVTDVCMDESAVSSNPVVAFLLDEVVVKDWCRRTFDNIISDLRGIYTLEVEGMRTRLGLLLRFSGHLSGISTVLEVLESSFRGTLSAQLNDLHHLQENVLKAKQHLEIMIWCIKHQFLESVKSRYSNFTSWCTHVRERKSAAIRRAWPDMINSSQESTQQDGSTLFIEDAISNLEIEQGYGQAMGDGLEVTSLQKDVSSLSIFRSRMGAVGCYPFENLRAATDMLFLYGSSDMVVAKRAIFLYYLFDWHWTMPDEKWRYVIDDFAATFGITRHSLLESLTFYLLDDHTDEALQEACRLLPEIASPVTHPKISQVLLERQNPEAALMVLRWSGRDGLSGYANTEHGEPQPVTLREAVTAVRVRVECGLLTESFMYQRTHCMKVKEDNLKHGSSRALSDGLNGQYVSWVDQMEALVTEICCLCIRRNLVDRMIELPWNSDEEKYLHKCLLDYATEDPSTTIGSLLVVFYLQRYRYIEACQVDHKLQTLEQDFTSKTPISELAASRIKSISHWRTGLVNKCIELLPEVHRQQIISGNLDVCCLPAAKDVETCAKSLKIQQPASTNFLLPMSSDPSVLQMDHTTPYKKTSLFDTPAKLVGSARNSQFERGNFYSPSILPARYLTSVAGGPSSPHNRDNLTSSYVSTRERRSLIGMRQNFKRDDASSPESHLVSPQNSTPLKVGKGSTKMLQSSYFGDNRLEKVSPGMEQNGFVSQAEKNNPLYSFRDPIDPITTRNSNNRFLKDSLQDWDPTVSGRPAQSDKPWKAISAEDPMDVSWSHENRDSPIEVMDADNGLRWRSDETSEDDDEPTPQRVVGKASSVTPARRTRRSRFTRR
ncbi:PREDICTED: E3 ubiquitin-protein ligase HOS1 isoform X2 [Nelumbo nucifera]|uniref:E3 ubiquitin-protein ligase HOS1 isoform X2 n=1 Tax=Nelumbo nucifera TaxID=4432 RepID=A0A1U8B745_NELNU|nr:PREDICTED: E3 ubiquitin-protein ligase HOS1 isoform X2 [Nelumbo nucifera]